MMDCERKPGTAHLFFRVAKLGLNKPQKTAKQTNYIELFKISVQNVSGSVNLSQPIYFSKSGQTGQSVTGINGKQTSDLLKFIKFKMSCASHRCTWNIPSICSHSVIPRMFYA